METKPLKFTNITADIVTDADTDADVMETQLNYLFKVNFGGELVKETYA